MSLLLRLERQQKDLLKSSSNSHTTLSFLFSLEFCYFLFICEYSPVVPLKTIPESRPKRKKNLYPFSDRNGAKTIQPFGAAQTRDINLYRGIPPDLFFFFFTITTLSTSKEIYFTGAPNENIVQNHLNIALLNVF